MTNIEHNFLIKLINAVKEYPQLYDYEKYPPAIRDIQNECAKIWTKISEELGEPRELCKKKWQVVRGSYQRYLKQINVAKVPYYLSGHMGFLLPLYSNKFKPEPQTDNVFENFYDDDDDDDDEGEGEGNGDDDDDGDNEYDKDGNRSDEDDEWLTNNMLKHEIDNDNEPFESISIEEEILSSNNQSNELKLPDTKYFNDMPFAIKLLNNIKKFPDLYTTEGRPISDSAFIWDKISKDLGETQEICRKKWRVIRGSYQRYLKKIATAPTPYYLSEYMKFLLPFYGSKYLPKSHKYLIEEYLEKLKNSDNDHLIEYNDNSLEEINFIDINRNKRKPNEELDNIKNITEIKRIKIEDKGDVEDKRDFEDNGDLIFLKSLLPDLKLLDTNQKITFRISVLNLVKELLEKKDCVYK